MIPKLCQLDPFSPGCKQGESWCNDPRCSPYCNNCPAPPHHDIFNNAFFVLLIFVFACIVIVLFLWLYYDNSSKFKKSQSYKNF